MKCKNFIQFSYTKQMMSTEWYNMMKTTKYKQLKMSKQNPKQKQQTGQI